MRCEASFRVTAQQFPPSAVSGTASIRGESRNVSNSGICVLLDEPCQVSSLLRCELFLTGSAVSIPTLAYVRWIQNHQHADFLAGLEFLL